MSLCQVHRRRLDPDATAAERMEAEWTYALAVEIDRLLKERGLTRRGFARQLEKRPTEVSRWLSGKHHFALRTLALISAALGTDLLAGGLSGTALREGPGEKKPAE